MSKSTLVIIIYALGIIFGALIFNIWSAETGGPKAFYGILWTVLFLISGFACLNRYIFDTLGIR